MGEQIYWGAFVLSGAVFLAGAARLIVSSPIFHTALYYVADFFLSRIEAWFTFSHVTRKGGNEAPGWRPPLKGLQLESEPFEPAKPRAHAASRS